jgi:hypothetical protein
MLCVVWIMISICIKYLRIPISTQVKNNVHIQIVISYLCYALSGRAAAGVLTRAHSRLCERVLAGVALKLVQSKRAETGRLLLLSSLWRTRPSTSKMCIATPLRPPHPPLPLWEDKHLAAISRTGACEGEGHQSQRHVRQVRAVYTHA